MLKACNGKEGNGWIQYDWPNAVSKKVEAKQSYAEKQGTVCWASGFSL
jgi:signal transduction histidine kinase